jgi:hypothetical protein
MERLRARVQQGRLVLDEPTDLPEGTVLDLVADDEGDDLDERERAALERAVSAASQSLKSGRGRPAADVLRELPSDR